jgi:hypothetical protein
MKFTKEQAFESLKSLLTDNGKKNLRMSERSINEHLDNLMPLVANDEMELTTFIEKVQKVFETTNNNVSNVVSDYEKRLQGLQNPNPTPTPKPTPTPDGNSDAMEKLLARLDALEKENSEAKLARTISDKRSALKSALKEKGIKNEKWIDSLLAKVSVSEKTDINAEADDYLKLYNQQQARPNPATPLGSGGGNNDDNPLKSVSEYMKQQQQAREAILNK